MKKMVEKKASGATAKCPECGGKYVKATKYCPSCKKKVKESHYPKVEDYVHIGLGRKGGAGVYGYVDRIDVIEGKVYITKKDDSWTGSSRYSGCIENTTIINKECDQTLTVDREVQINEEIILEVGDKIEVIKEQLLAYIDPRQLALDVNPFQLKHFNSEVLLYQEKDRDTFYYQKLIPNPMATFSGGFTQDGIGVKPSGKWIHEDDFVLKVLKKTKSKVIIVGQDDGLIYSVKEVYNPDTGWIK